MIGFLNQVVRLSFAILTTFIRFYPKTFLLPIVPT
jgi:hypothetical protein